MSTLATTYTPTRTAVKDRRPKDEALKGMRVTRPDKPVEVATLRVDMIR